jgi:hypothetical protein
MIHVVVTAWVHATTAIAAIRTTIAVVTDSAVIAAATIGTMIIQIDMITIAADATSSTTTS